MNIKEVLNSKVLDKNAYEVGTVTAVSYTHLTLPTKRIV